jgi:hypothetical protein
MLVESTASLFSVTVSRAVIDDELISSIPNKFKKMWQPLLLF